MRKGMIFIVMAVLLLAIGIAIFQGGSVNSRVVETVQVKRGDIINFVKATGRVEAVEEAVIRARADARIERVLVEEGNSVNIGDELVLFDLTESKDAVERARLKLEQAEITLQKTKMKLNASEQTYSDPSELKSNLKEKEARYQQAVIARDSAERELKVSKELYKIQAESLLNLKTKEDRLKKTEVELLQTKQELEEAKELFVKREKTRINLSTLKLEHELAIREKALAEAGLELAISQLNRLKATSPLNGTVVSKAVKEGMVVSVGQPLMTIADTGQLQVRAEVDEVDAGRIKKGQESVITFDAFPDREFYGHVTRVAPQAVIKGERTVVETLILMNERIDLLKIGNQVDVRIIIERKKDVLHLPLSVVHRVDRPFVWLYQDGKAHKVGVNTGLSDLDSIEITGGLKEGNAVIIGSGVELRDEEKVKIE